MVPNPVTVMTFTSPSSFLQSPGRPQVVRGEDDPTVQQTHVKSCCEVSASFGHGCPGWVSPGGCPSLRAETLSPPGVGGGNPGLRPSRGDEHGGR